jgi:hypothetical protein
MINKDSSQEGGYYKHCASHSGLIIDSDVKISSYQPPVIYNILIYYIC